MRLFPLLSSTLKRNERAGLQSFRKQIRFNDKKHLEIVQSLISFSSSFDHRFQVTAILFWFASFFPSTHQKLKFS